LCAIFDKAVFQFQKRRQLFIHAHNETLSVAALDVNSFGLFVFKLGKRFA
jgi:hypothetical protein